MDKRNGRKRSGHKRKEDNIPILRVRKGATLREIYAVARRSFSAADLQKYTEEEEGVPLEVIIAQMEAIQSEQMQRRL